MELIGVAVIVALAVVVLVVVMQADARERQWRADRAHAHTLRLVMESRDREMNRLLPPHDLTSQPEGAGVDGPSSAADDMARAWDATADDKAVYDPINLDKPLDDVGDFYGQDDVGADELNMDVGVDVLADEVRERAMIVPPGFDPLAEIRANIAARER